MAFGPNLLTNPGAEASADGYSADGGTVSRVTSPTRTGGGAFQMQGDSSPGTLLLFRSGRITSLVPGRSIVLDAYARAGSTGRSFTMLLDYELNAGGYGGTSSTPTVTTNAAGWTRATVTQTVPRGVNEALVYFKLENVGAGELHYLDDLSVTMDDGAGGGNVITRPPAVVLNATPGQPVWGDTVTVAVTGSDFTGLSTAVTRPSGSAAVLGGATTAAPSLKPDVLGDYLFTTTATGPGGTSTASRLVTVGAQSYVKTGTGVVKPAVRVIRTPGPVVPSQPTAPTAEQVLLSPFTATSPWNLRRAAAATFEAAGTAKISNLQAAPHFAWVTPFDSAFTHRLLGPTTDADPLATLHRPDGGQPNTTFRVKSTYLPEVGSDKHLHVVQPNGTQVMETWLTDKISDTLFHTGRYALVDYTGSGIGPTNGTRAYGGSSMGGIIRAWEVDPAHPSFTGRIDHAVSLMLPWDALYWNPAATEEVNSGSFGYGYRTGGTNDGTQAPGWPVGHPLAGFMKTAGFVWPATEQDYDSRDHYTGTVPMGAMLSIPNSVDIETLGLSWAGKMLAYAYQNHGGYVCDTVGSDPAIVLASVEPTTTLGGTASSRRFTDQLINAPVFDATDCDIILANLRVVTGNTSATPGGGTLGAARRPQSPAITPPPVVVTPPTDPSVTTLTGSTFGGTWESFADAQFAGGSIHFTNTFGAALTVPINGGASGGTVRIYGGLGTGKGIYRYKIDSGSEVEVDNYRATDVAGGGNLQATFSIPAGSHSLTLTAYQQSNPASTGSVVEVDYMTVTT